VVINVDEEEAAAHVTSELRLVRLGKRRTRPRVQGYNREAQTATTAAK
jgi:hypothetical protein